MNKTIKQTAMIPFQQPATAIPCLLPTQPPKTSNSCELVMPFIINIVCQHYRVDKNKANPWTTHYIEYISTSVCFQIFTSISYSILLHLHLDLAKVPGRVGFGRVTFIHTYEAHTHTRSVQISDQVGSGSGHVIHIPEAHTWVRSG